MGIRFRKSWRVAPGVRVGVGRKSASVSVGVKGARVTKSTTGRTTTSVGIPGSGLSHVSSSGGGKGKRVPASNPQQQPTQVQQQQIAPLVAGTPAKPRSSTATTVVGVIAVVVVLVVVLFAML